jgi:hypothetical protein
MCEDGLLGGKPLQEQITIRVQQAWKTNENQYKLMRLK